MHYQRSAFKAFGLRVEGFVFFIFIAVAVAKNIGGGGGGCNFEDSKNQSPASTWPYDLMRP